MKRNLSEFLNFFSAIRLILAGVAVVTLTGWTYLEYHYTIDYAWVFQVIKEELMGKDVTCLDLPEDKWRRIKDCHPDYQDERPKGGVDSDAA